MTDTIQTYQCPACNGPLQYSAATGKLECEYCGSSFELPQAEDPRPAEPVREPVSPAPAAGSNEWDDSGLSGDWGEDLSAMRSYSCPACGAQLICEHTTAATACPYCGNPTVVPGQFAGTLRPDYVIPFRISREQAIEALKKHYSGKKYLPNAFTREQQLEKIQGIYVPFWLFDGRASGSYELDAGTVSTQKTSREEITVTRHFRLLRQGSIDFEKVPVDASSKMPDGHMDSIEPYDYAQLKPFSTAYLPGFLADRYDRTVSDCSSRADARCGKTLEDAICATAAGYDFHSIRSRDVRITRGKVHYALLPVWLLHVKWSGKGFLFAVNGQTGKLVGDLPIDRMKVLLAVARIAVPLAIAGNLIVKFFVA